MRSKCCPPPTPPVPPTPPPPSPVPDIECCRFRPGDLMVAGEFLLEADNTLFVQHAVNITALTVGRPSATDPTVRAWHFVTGPLPSPDCLGAIVNAFVAQANFPFGDPAAPVQTRIPVIPRVRLTNVLPGPTPDCIIAEGEIVLLDARTGEPVDPAVAFGDESSQDPAVHLSIFAGGIDRLTATE